MHVHVRKRKKARKNLVTNTKIPNGGWVFHIGKITLIGESRDKLIENLKQYREANKIPLGNLSHDVDSQIKESEPTYQIPSFKMVVKK